MSAADGEATDGANLRPNLPVDGRRLWDDLMALAAVTEPDRPWTRRAFSPRFLEGRVFLRRRFEEAGLDCRIDAAGNLVGRLPGTEPGLGTIVIGSHSDTVPEGGRFDGPAGVLAGLEIARSLRHRGVRLRHPLEVVDFLAEEPSPYGLSCIGSRGWAGALNPEHLDLRDPDGEPLRQGLERVGGSVENLEDARRTDVAAAFELHIEQGPVLEAEQIDLGLVTAIAGIRRLRIAFAGAADHAGTTPLPLRRDAALAAAEMILAVRQEAERGAAAGRGHFVATSGVVRIEPNAANVVPRAAELVVDIRYEDRALADAFVLALDAATRNAAERARVDRAAFAVASDSPPAACDERLRRLLGEAAGRLDLSARSMASGAGHDTAYLARIAPAAMIFVPCRGGKSHVPEEWAEPDAIAAGAACLLEAVLAFDAERSGPPGQRNT
jgi:beta-ureidopropionase / N-carbamoyl-L-amino-acid hydrolase